MISDKDGKNFNRRITFGLYFITKVNLNFYHYELILQLENVNILKQVRIDKLNMSISIFQLKYHSWV